MRIYIDSCGFGEEKYRTLLQVISQNRIVYEGVMQSAKASLIELPGVRGDLTFHFSIIQQEAADNYNLVPVYDFDPNNLIPGSKVYNTFIDRIDYKKVGPGRENDILPIEWIYAFDLKISKLCLDEDDICIIFPKSNNVCDDIAIGQVLNDNVDVKYSCNLTGSQLNQSCRVGLKKRLKVSAKVITISVIAMIVLLFIDQNITFYVGEAVYGLIIFFILLVPVGAVISNLKRIFQVYKIIYNSIKL